MSDHRHARTVADQRPDRRLLSPLRDFLAAEAAGSVLLALGAAAALVWANSPWSTSYADLWDAVGVIGVGGHELRLDLRQWIDDGAMSIFFLVVGLEIKRETTSGHLATRRAALLPVVAALGGMITPALVYLAIAGSDAPRGWAVPIATDIALALGVLAVAGDRMAPSMRALLLGLAIVDDIGAIVVIAVAYSHGVRLAWLAAGVAAVASVVVLRAMHIHSAVPYVAVGVAVWLSLHEAGVHPTLAGVAMGLLAPSTPRIPPELVDVDELQDVSSVEAARATTDIARGSVSIVEWLLHALHPWTSYVVVPVFALANAGVEISGSTVSSALRSTLAWGIVAGLVVGKPLGVVLATRGAVRTGLADRPAGSTRSNLLSVGTAAGIGFTVALFVTDLAFDDPRQIAVAKLAVVTASVLAALTSAAVQLCAEPSSPVGGGSGCASSRT